MTPEEFETLHDMLEKNIEEIKSTLTIRDLLENPDYAKTFERMRYLFYSVVTALVDMGHNIILEKDFRDPLNRADVFISLGEHGIVMPSVVPGLKKALRALPQMNELTPTQVRELVSETIDDVYKCLDSFVVYFELQDYDEKK
ncbi:hypothetical protein AMJ87_02570 [candidate division WOR_3 bacterium SM23_60]|uniref:DUF86 domain-containing protein n=1 Tax=candidate division WOR_3 bacterium SM23_60 TaxID=1703780 RepID=A0A0S8GKG6_UNCW3|nr:MAG: hypothetical protein AMJ87_02570 [candidate division WOR_3 bacterium SM23_60]